MHLQGHDDILNIKATILSKGLWDDQQRVCESLYSHFDPSLGCLLNRPTEMCSTGDFECAGSRDQAFVFECILHGTEAVAKRILNLLDRMCVGALDQKRDALRVFDFFEERELLFSQRVLIDEASPAENVRGEVINGVLGYASTNELQPVR